MMPLRLKWQLFCFRALYGGICLYPLIEAEILNSYNNNPLHLKSTSPLTKCFHTQDLI